MASIYNISHLSKDGSTFSATITFNPSHPVFAGHFPGQPIVPGVVLVEISAAFASKLTGTDLVVNEASVIKFLQVIDPLQYQIVFINGSIVEEDDGRYKLDLNFSADWIIFAKLKGIRLRPIKD